MNAEATYQSYETDPLIDELPAEHMRYDVVVIGGGLGGIAAAIQLAKADFRVALLEKEEYPFHKVCGEYISLECWNFLEGLGYPLSDMDLPFIRKLMVSAPNGNSLERALPLGGFGISRYKIDSGLAAIAVANGVDVRENDKVVDISYGRDLFMIRSSRNTLVAKSVVGSFGKRSNLDLKWKRPFVLRRNDRFSNYVGIKYHIRLESDPETIALHNFSDGYCGISRVENGTWCLCYLTRAANLGKTGNDIHAMEQLILSRNPWLRNIFEKAEFLWKEPLTIAQVSFAPKEQVENHILMVGDAAGLIAPLCGNGMSMALHASKIAAELLGEFLSGKISRTEMEEEYEKRWKSAFGRRVWTGRLIQAFFGKAWITNIFIWALKPFPRFTGYLIRQTHGEPF